MDEKLQHYIIENQNLKEIFEVARQITSGLDITFIIKSISMFLASKFDPEFLAFILKKDIDDNTPIYHCYKDNTFSFQELKSFSIEELNSFFERQEFTQISFEQFKSIFHKKKVLKEISRDNPEFLIPLKSHKAIVGLFLQGKKGNKSPYTLEDIQFCIDILSFAAISIENANLYREAIVDRMTKLYTHHQFHENLRKYINMGHRYGKKFSIIMLDIDHFKSINDKYGHLVGDFVIKEIANIIVNTVRNVDIACRYGGEEFTVLLPEIELNSALSVAERLRRKIEEYEFRPEKNIKLKITASMGVIEFNPEHVKYNEEILEPLDKALYCSKQNGRNRITLGKYEN